MKLKTTITRCLYIALFGFFFAPTLYANKVFEHPLFHTPSDLMSGVEGDVISIVEDQQGLIWFVSSNGLWRWDAHVAVAAQFDEDNPKPPQIQTVHASNDGLLFVGTSRGLFDVQEHTMLMTPILPDALGNISIQEITTGSGDVFVAADRGVYRLSADFKTLTEIVLPFDARIHALFYTDGTLWIGTGNGLLLFDTTTGQIEPLAGFPAGIRISAITSGDGSTIAIGTANRGLFLSGADNSLEHFSFDSAAEPWIYSLTQVSPSKILLGTFGKGLIELDPTTSSTRYFEPNPLHPASLGHDNVWTLLTDSRGLVWLGANTSLQIYEVANTGVKQVFGGIDDDGLVERQVNAVVTLNGGLIVGTGRSGIEKYNPITGKSTRIWDDGQDPIETLAVANNDTVFVSSNFKSAFVDIESGNASPLLMSGRPSDSYSSAYVSHRETQWIGGTDGLWQSDAESNITRNLLLDGHQERRVASLLLADSTVWIGTWHGLYRQEIQGDTATPVMAIPNAPLLLQEQFISSMYHDQHNRLWIGTSNAGLFVRDTNENWQQIDVATNQVGGTVESIAGEWNNHLYLATSQRIVAVDMTDFEVIPIVQGSMAVNRPFRRGAAASMWDKVMVFGGSDGLTLIDAELASLSASQRDVLLTDTTVIAADNSTVSSQWESSTLTVPPLTKRMSFEFTALEYLAPKQISYRYRLLGLDKEWTVTDAEHRVATITQPDPGEYTLEVEYSYDSQHWINQQFNKHIVVPPAWYQTWIAKTAFVIFVVFGVYVAHKLRVQKLRRRQAVLERRVEARTAELIEANKVLNKQAEALREASMTDALTGLHNRRFLAQNIERDIAKLHRYYEDCNTSNLPPNTSNDLLFFLIDLDHFKSINDNFGHQIGDHVLVETQYRLRRVFREVDYIIRWGGEEFLVVVQQTPRHDAEMLAERVLAEIGQTPYVLKNGLEHRVTCSVGLAAYPLSIEHFSALHWETSVAIADIALYAAKNNQRDTWMGFTEIAAHTTQDDILNIQREPALILEHAEIKTRGKTKPFVTETV